MAERDFFFGGNGGFFLRADIGAFFLDRGTGALSLEKGLELSSYVYEQGTLPPVMTYTILSDIHSCSSQFLGNWGWGGGGGGGKWMFVCRHVARYYTDNNISTTKCISIIMSSAPATILLL